MSEEANPAAPATKPLARINCSDLAQVLRFRGQHDVRYYLNGFYAEPLEEGCLLVATDGHRLGVIRSTQSHVLEPVVVRTTPQIDNIVAGRNHEDELVLDDRKGLLRIERNNLATHIQPGQAYIECKYVDWRKVIPPNEQLVDGLPGTIDCRYLKSAIDALAATASYPAGISFQHRKTEDVFGTGAIIIRSANSELVVVVMPMKWERSPMPAWLYAKKSDASPADAAPASA